MIKLSDIVIDSSMQWLTVKFTIEQRTEKLQDSSSPLFGAQMPRYLIQQRSLPQSASVLQIWGKEENKPETILRQWKTYLLRQTQLSGHFPLKVSLQISFKHNCNPTNWVFDCTFRCRFWFSYLINYGLIPSYWGQKKIDYMKGSLQLIFDVKDCVGNVSLQGRRKETYKHCGHGSVGRRGIAWEMRVKFVNENGSVTIINVKN